MLFVVGVLEVALRAVQHQRGTYSIYEEGEVALKASIWKKSSDPILIYTHRPNYFKHGIQYTESHGILRPQSVNENRVRGVFRIALIGDSLAAGIYLDYKDRVGTRLENLLNARVGGSAQRVEVLNFGVNGYRTTQEARYVETNVAKFDPDVLVLLYCMNDPGNSLTPTIWFMGLHPPLFRLADFIERRLGFKENELSPELSDAVPVFGPDYGSSKYWFRLYERNSRSWKSVGDGFRSIDAYSRSRRIPVVLVIFPFFLDGKEAWKIAEPYHRQVQEEGYSLGWTVLDLLGVYDKYPIEEVRENDQDIYHPSAKGDKVAAEAIFSKLTESGIVEKSLGKLGE